MSRRGTEVLIRYDFNCCIDCALRRNNPDRLLWFARIRNILIEQKKTPLYSFIWRIINCFKSEVQQNSEIAHWPLHILQMCMEHCTEDFIETLNNQQFLDSLQEALTKHRYTESIRLKVFTLLGSWHEQCKGLASDSAFEKAYEAAINCAESLSEKPVNLHWFPDRNILGESLDSVSYNLNEVGEELLKHTNTYIHELNVFIAEHQQSKFEERQKLLNMARVTLRRVEADLKFWNDIVEHADNLNGYLQDMEVTSDKFRKMESEVQEIIENLQTSGTSSSRPGAKVPGSGQQSHEPHLEGEDLTHDGQSAQPMKQSLSSGSYDLNKTGKDLVDRNSTKLAYLKACAASEQSSVEETQKLLESARATLREVETDLKSWENIAKNAPDSDGSVVNIAATGEELCKVKTGVEQIIERLVTKQSLSSGSYDLNKTGKDLVDRNSTKLAYLKACAASEQSSVIPNSGSCHTEHPGNISQGDTTAGGSDDHTNNTRNGQQKNAYEEILERNRYRLHDQNSGPQINGSAGDRSVVSKSNVGIDQESSHSENFQRANWMCPICRTGFQEKLEYITHLSSLEHKTKVAQLPPLPTDDNEPTYGRGSTRSSWV